jgi:hypothetical protein
MTDPAQQQGDADALERHSLRQEWRMPGCCSSLQLGHVAGVADCLAQHVLVWGDWCWCWRQGHLLAGA